jgi:hypothetical protein
MLPVRVRPREPLRAIEPSKHSDHTGSIPQLELIAVAELEPGQIVGGLLGPRSPAAAPFAPVDELGRHRVAWRLSCGLA